MKKIVDSIIRQKVSQPPLSRFNLDGLDSEKPVKDSKKRFFLKTVGAVGIGALIYSLFSKKAQALVFGSSMRAPDPIGLKNSSGTQINPATEDTLGNIKTATEAATRAAVTTFVNNQRIDDSPTSYNSSSLDTSNYRYFMLYVNIDSTGSGGHRIRVKPQFSDDSGTTWFDYKDGHLGNLEWEDADTASGKYECVGGTVCGRLFRVRVEGTSTTASLYFDITVKGEFWN